MNKPIEIMFEHKGSWMFETIECRYYIDSNNKYWYEFQDSVNRKLTGPYFDRTEAFKDASIYYAREWVPF
jgi:hypothetical protein